MPQQLFSRYAQIAILLETVVQKVLDYRRHALWDRGTIILDYAEERRHGTEEVVRRFAFKKLNYSAAYTPAEINEMSGDSESIYWKLTIYLRQWSLQIVLSPREPLIAQV